MKIDHFEDIEAWQLARELTRKVYRLTKKPGFATDYGLKKQIQDAVVRGLTISKNMMISRQSTVNREPNNLSRYKI
ncbi:MAG: four helix bundle protein [Proteobacteria bacterium]|nr:four helix bundle protein [Pseudomonadota bacterium]